MLRILCAMAVALPLSAGAAAADDDVTVYQSREAFEDVAFNIRNAIIDRGYVVDYHGRIGEMLQRTAQDVGARKTLYRNAEFFQFCSAVLSRAVMEEDVGNIAYCPYILFAYESEADPGTVILGFRHLPSGGKRDEVNALLDEIAREAADQ